jgi:hypothetical protein
MAITVQSLSQFIDYIISESVHYDHEIFWRGHSDRNYKQVPNIYRKTSRLVGKEDLILKEAEIRHPEDFSKRSSSFEKLALMQHYEFPTRLLDVTENPLVALYFACKTNHKKIGEVVRFGIKRDSVKYYDSDLVSVLSALSCIPPARFDGLNQELQERITGSQSPSLREIKKRLAQNTLQTPVATLAKYLAGKNRPQHIKDILLEIFNQCSLVDFLVHQVKAEKAHFKRQVLPQHFHDCVACAKSKYDSRRIAAQQGAFLLFGIKDGEKLKPAAIDEDVIEISRITIANSSKPLLLKQLEKLGVSDDRMFPELTYSAKAIKTKLSI